MKFKPEIYCINYSFCYWTLWWWWWWWLLMRITPCESYSYRTNSHSLSERLASLGIMGTPSRAPFKPFNIIVLLWRGGSRRALNQTPMMQKEASLSDSYSLISHVFRTRISWLQTSLEPVLVGCKPVILKHHCEIMKLS